MAMRTRKHIQSLVWKFAVMLTVLAVFALIETATAQAQTSEPLSQISQPNAASEGPEKYHTQPEAQTLLFVKTTPDGAEVWLDGKKIGVSGKLLRVEPGTYRLVVDMAGHKPRKEKITIEDGRITRIEWELDRVVPLPTNAPNAQLPTNAQFVGRTTLKYDDGRADGRRSLGGSGEMIRFTMPEGKWLVRGIQLHGSRYGNPQAPNEDFQIYLLDKDFSVIATEDAPYRLFRRSSAKWVRIRFEEPVEVPNEFWVCVNFNAQRTKGVYVSFDTSTGGKHSKIGLPEDDKKNVTFGGDWMIRVDLTPADKVAKSGSRSQRTTLKHDDGKADGKRSIGGSGEIIRYTLPDGDWLVRGVQIHGSRYGMPRAPAEDFQIYFLDKNLSGVVAMKEAPYRQFQRGREKWVRIRFKEPVKVPKDFWVCVNFNAHQTKGVYVSVDKSSGGKFSKTGLPQGEKRDVTSGSDWMIRVDLIKSKEGATQSKQTPVTASKSVAKIPPLVVATSPKVGARDVDPMMTEITVTFDRDMASGFSWTGGGEDFPDATEGQPPFWRDKRTCVYPVTLEAERYYRIGINSDSFKNFKSVEGVPADPTEIYFTTFGADEETLAQLNKPRIVSMVPANGATDVDPNLKTIRVTFDRKMGPAYSWTGGGEHFPTIPKGKKPRWSKNGKTCYLPVELKPNWDYRLGLNSPSFKNFKTAAGVALDPVVYRFRTRSE